MRRRTLLKTVATALVVRPVAALPAPGQAEGLSGAQIETLKAIAVVVLPTAIGSDGRDRAVASFANWVAGYRAGADMGHGYGASTLRAASGPSPASRYPAQFAALDAAARNRGARSFVDLAVGARRQVIEELLNTPQPVTRLPSQPTGANLIADFMGRYFTSAAAWDLCYRAEIRRDSCRGLDNSAEPPAPIRGR